MHPSILTESAIRYAKAFNNRIAFKVNFSYMQGTDWRSNTQRDQNTNDLKKAPTPGFPFLMVQIMWHTTDGTNTAMTRSQEAMSFPSAD